MPPRTESPIKRITVGGYDRAEMIIIEHRVLTQIGIALGRYIDMERHPDGETVTFVQRCCACREHIRTPGKERTFNTIDKIVRRLRSAYLVHACPSVYEQTADFTAEETQEIYESLESTAVAIMNRAAEFKAKLGNR